MQDDIRASLDDLAIRWETPRGRELKRQIIADARTNGGAGIAEILKDFMYVREVPHGRDLRCITLEDEDLSDAKFGKVDLSWASLAGSKLLRCNLENANLKRVNARGADFSFARLDGADCSRADFTGAKLDGAHFREAKATGAVFVEADLSRASFDSANLGKANFCRATLAQTNLHNADCNNCNFDSGALDAVAERPAKAWGLRYDLEQAEFEKQVGLKAMTSRSTKRFKGLEMLLKAQAQAEKLGVATKPAKPPKPQEVAPPSARFQRDDGGLFFGTHRFRKVSEEETKPQEPAEPTASVADRPPPRQPRRPRAGAARASPHSGRPAGRSGRTDAGCRSAWPIWWPEPTPRSALPPARCRPPSPATVRRAAPPQPQGPLPSRRCRGRAAW
ncbi:MAG: hypothetical protein D6731_19570 [Planctomycetota bacterium]|nr:MAG: hypothetical protein D6731_19570 [Planctomycetota bacterium]